MTKISKEIKEEITLKMMREYLNKNESHLSDEQLVSIREYLFELAQIDYEIFIKNEVKEMDMETFLQITPIDKAA